jgi:hypothetical protein
MEDQAKSGYKGRWKKWLLIYLAIGAVAYLIIYLVFFHHSGGYGGGGGGGGTGGYLIVPLLVERGRSLTRRWQRRGSR